MSFVVGFDLDMTLIDPRPGMVALFDEIAAETGHPLDGKAFVTRLGPPLHQELARYGLDAQTIAALVRRFRERYADVVIPQTVAMPGAAEAIQAVRDRGGRTIVVSAKYAAHARRHLELLQLPADVVVGERWSQAKGQVLAEHGAEIYVGDHLGDITGARAADALSVGVATGPISADDLRAAGADVVLRDLTAFPRWLESYLVATVH